MHFKPEMEIKHFPAHLRYFISITGWRPWHKRLGWLQDQVRNHTAMAHYLNDRYGLELAFLDMNKRKRKTGKHIRNNQTDAELRFLSFVCMTSLIYRNLSSQGCNRMKGMLLDALKSDYGLGPISYEIKVATHLMRLEFDVEFSDLEGQDTFDLLARKGNACLEIECKFISADIGKKIHQKRLFQFGNILEPRLRKFLNGNQRGTLVRLNLSDRLYGEEKQQEELSNLVCSAVSEMREYDHNDGNQVVVREFDVFQSPFERSTIKDISRIRISNFVSERFGLDNKNILAIFNENNQAIIVVVESNKSNKVLDGILRQLKEAAKKKFSGLSPAVLCCHLADVTEGELLSLRNSGDDGVGLDYMTSRLLLDRPKLLSVSYTTSGSVEERRFVSGELLRTHLQEKGPAYTIKNPEHPLARDSRYSIFDNFNQL